MVAELAQITSSPQTSIPVNNITKAGFLDFITLLLSYRPQNESLTIAAAFIAGLTLHGTRMCDFLELFSRTQSSPVAMEAKTNRLKFQFSQTAVNPCHAATRRMKKGNWEAWYLCHVSPARIRTGNGLWGIGRREGRQQHLRCPVYSMTALRYRSDIMDTATPQPGSIYALGG
jgi:hypothetical protein